jgi:ketosteroid isomerase-like protein
MKAPLFVFIAILVALIGCNKPKTSVQDLFDADMNFSQLSIDSGFAKAFIQYAHPDAVLLRKNSKPVKGREEISGLYQGSVGSVARLTWVPLDGIIAESGEIGYTYGIYTFQSDTIVKKGTYVTVWKKDSSGLWKYILDTGNEGIGE